MYSLLLKHLINQCVEGVTNYNKTFLLYKSSIIEKHDYLKSKNVSFQHNFSRTNGNIQFQADPIVLNQRA